MPCRSHGDEASVAVRRAEALEVVVAHVILLLASQHCSAVLECVGEDGRALEQENVAKALVR